MNQNFFSILHKQVVIISPLQLVKMEKIAILSTQASKLN